MRTKGKIKVTALAIIFNDQGEVLITKRYQPSSLYAHNKWQLPGGEVEFGESPEETMIREVAEEVGIRINVLTHQPILYNSVHQNHIILMCFPVMYAGGTVDISKDDESSEYEWRLPQDIDYANALTGTQEIIEEALKIKN